MHCAVATAESLRKLVNTLENKLHGLKMKLQMMNSYKEKCEKTLRLDHAAEWPVHSKQSLTKAVISKTVSRMAGECARYRSMRTGNALVLMHLKYYISSFDEDSSVEAEESQTEYSDLGSDEEVETEVPTESELKIAEKS